MLHKLHKFKNGRRGEVLKTSQQLHGRLLKFDEWTQPILTPGKHPLILSMLQAGYEQQLLHEAAVALLEEGEERWESSILPRVLKYRKSLVKLYDHTVDKYVIVIWCTARDECIKSKPELVSCLEKIAEINASNRSYPKYTLVTGGSVTGGMGAAINAFSAHHLEVVNVLLGFTEEHITEAPAAYGVNSPPFYSFFLRLPVLNILGRKVLRVTLDGGGGTTHEVASDIDEAIMCHRTETVYTERGNDPIPSMVWVSTSTEDGGYFYDGLQRHLRNMDHGKTAFFSELPPIHQIVLDMNEGDQRRYREQHGEDWVATHKQPLLSPTHAAEKIMQFADEGYRSMQH